MISVVNQISNYKIKSLHLLCGGIFLLFSACSDSDDSKNKKEDTPEKETKEQSSKIESGDYIQLTGEAQGTTYSIIYETNETGVLKEEIDSLLLDFDNSLSTYNPGSLISEFNANKEVVPDQNFREVLALSRVMYQKTGQAFNPAIYPIIELWGIERDDSELVEHEDVVRTLEQCRFDDIQYDSEDTSKLIALNDNMIEFNAIAQGFSVDLVARFLESNGIDNYLVEIGGELFGKGLNQNEGAWKVGVEEPQEEKTQVGEPLALKIELDNKGLATSGSYRKYKMKDGKRLSHTIDPETGYPSTNSLLSVTVIAENAAIADAYATAFMVMGLDKTLEFLEAHAELDVFLIYDDNGELKSFKTEGLEKLIPNA